MSEGDGERTALRRWAATLALSGRGSRAGGEATRNAGWASAEGGGELGYARDGPVREGKDRADQAGKLGRGEGKVGRQVWDGEKGSGPWAGLSAGFPFLFYSLSFSKSNQTQTI